MACYHPIPAYQGGVGEEVRLWPPIGTATHEVPCGQCLGCRTDTAAEWARRAVHEASLWEHNSFLTLTYNDEHLPKSGDLEPEVLRGFIKRLRRHQDRKHPALLRDGRFGLRYLACGEYGDRTGRPHYHLLLFNCGFADGYQVGKDLRESPLLAKTWTLGVHRLGELTGASANYVAQYALKKQGGKTYADADGVVHPMPFMRSSLRPAIGHDWLRRFGPDLTHGFLVYEGARTRIPRSYMKKLAQWDAPLAEDAKFKAQCAPRRKDNLEAAEVIHKRRNALYASRSL